jgi:acyl carrier protein
MDNKQKIKEFIVETFGVLELVAFLESEFGMDIKDDELVRENLDSIDSLDGFIQRKT